MRERKTTKSARTMKIRAEVELQSPEEYKQAEAVIKTLQALVPDVNVQSPSQSAFLTTLRDIQAARTSSVQGAQQIDWLVRLGHSADTFADAFQTAILEPMAQPLQVVQVLAQLQALQLPSSQQQGVVSLCIRRVLSSLAVARDTRCDRTELLPASEAFAAFCYFGIVAPGNALLTVEQLMSKPHQIAAAAASLARLSELCASSLLNPNECSPDVLHRLKGVLLASCVAYPALQSDTNRVCNSLGWQFDNPAVGGGAPTTSESTSAAVSTADSPQRDDAEPLFINPIADAWDHSANVPEAEGLSEAKKTRDAKVDMSASKSANEQVHTIASEHESTGDEQYSADATGNNQLDDHATPSTSFFPPTPEQEEEVTESHEHEALHSDGTAPRKGLCKHASYMHMHSDKVLTLAHDPTDNVFYSGSKDGSVASFTLSGAVLSRLYYESHFAPSLSYLRSMRLLLAAACPKDFAVSKAALRVIKDMPSVKENGDSSSCRLMQDAGALPLGLPDPKLITFVQAFDRKEGDPMVVSGITTHSKRNVVCVHELSSSYPLNNQLPHMLSDDQSSMVHCAAIHPANPNILFIGLHDGAINVLDCRQKHVVASIHGPTSGGRAHNYFVTTLAAHANTLASGGGDGVVRWWDIRKSLVSAGNPNSDAWLYANGDARNNRLIDQVWHYICTTFFSRFHESVSRTILRVVN